MQISRSRLFALITIGAATIVPVVIFLAAIVQTGVISFTNTQLFPVYQFVGFSQYERLFTNDRFHVAFINLFIYGGLFISGALVIGFLLAVALDRRIRLEALFRTIFLYPLSMSFIVTGLAWQWFMNPTLGIEKFMQDHGFTWFHFNWVVDPDLAIYTLVIAAIWQASGLTMAILLAGLRGVDQEIWKAAAIDGVPVWRTYVSVILPMLQPMVMTCVVLLCMGVVKAYDLVVALTQGGPGYASDLPAKFVIDFTFERANIALASSGAIVMLITTVAVIAPYVAYSLHRHDR